MKLFLLTDLEGVAGVERFEQTRVKGPAKDAAMALLTGEVNAVIRGAREHDPLIDIHVWDGHGSGGLLEQDLEPDVHYIPPGRIHLINYFTRHGIDALAFVGQHAMGMTLGGNLCHTMSSLKVDYYSLNGALIGEFGLRALIAGEIGVPTIFISGDDKACKEASALIPSIVAIAVKEGIGWERAASLPIDQAREIIRDGIKESLIRWNRIKPPRVSHPVTLEISKKHWMYLLSMPPGGVVRGSRTILYKAGSLVDLVDKGVI